MPLKRAFELKPVGRRVVEADRKNAPAGGLKR
jgi:hypothetical protein